jgi:AraC-like DNA-binding protein
MTTFDSLDRWIAEHLNDDLRVGALAEQVHMSPRNFARAYAEKRGRTPAKAVEAIRVEAARRRLEQTEDRIESVAEDSGFSNEEQMRCSFIRILGIPPREYRKRFEAEVGAVGEFNCFLIGLSADPGKNTVIAGNLEDEVLAEQVCDLFRSRLLRHQFQKLLRNLKICLAAPAGDVSHAKARAPSSGGARTS